MKSSEIQEPEYISAVAVFGTRRLVYVKGLEGYWYFPGVDTRWEWSNLMKIYEGDVRILFEGVNRTVPCFDDVVESFECTCTACPTQYMGVLKDGRKFYFRFRGGNTRLDVGEDLDLAKGAYESARGSFGGPWDGYMTDDEFQDEFMRLYRSIGEVNSVERSDS